MPYSKNVIRRAEQILGYGITSIAGERTYPVIDGVVYADLFSEADPIVITGYTGTIKKAFNGRLNGLEYYNELILDTRHKKLKEVTVDLFWGNACFDQEITDLLDWLTENPSTESLDSAGVSNVKIEDFSQSTRTASEKSEDINIILNEGFGYYIRRPFIIDVAREQRDAARYF